MLWPLAAIVYVVAALTIPSPVPVAIWLSGGVMATPAAVDFALELTGCTKASPRRLVVLTLPLAIGIGLLGAAATVSTLV